MEHSPLTKMTSPAFFSKEAYSVGSTEPKATEKLFLGLVDLEWIGFDPYSTILLIHVRIHQETSHIDENDFSKERCSNRRPIFIKEFYYLHVLLNAKTVPDEMARQTE